MIFKKNAKCIIFIWLATLINMLSVVKADISIDHKTKPLNQYEVNKIILLFRGNDYNNDLIKGYAYGHKVIYKTNIKSYVVTHFLPISRKTVQKIYRLQAFQYTVYQSDLEKLNCQFIPCGNCDFKVLNYVGWDIQNPYKISSKNISEFVFLRHDFEDVTLAQIFKIIKIPLSEIIAKAKNDNIFISEGVIDLLMYKDVTGYRPISIDIAKDVSLPNDGRRSYKIRYCNRNSPKCSNPINIYMQNLSINSKKKKLRIIRGAIS